MYALAEIEEKAAAKYLMSALEDKNPRVRTAAAFNLCRMDYGEARDEIVRIMREDPVKHTRQSMAGYLGSMKSAPACDALIQVLSTDDERAVDLAIQSLGNLKCEDAVMPLSDLLESDPQLESNPQKINLIVRSLTEIGGSEAKAVFRDLFGKPESGFFIKAEAAVALAELGDPVGIPYLRNEGSTYPGMALRLARAGDYGAVPILIKKVTEKKWPEGRYTYGKALEELTGKKYGWDSRRWKRWWEKNKDELLQDTLSGNVHKGGN